MARTRLPGLLYALTGLFGVISLQVIPATFFVRGDAAATAQRISQAVPIYRLGILSDLLSQIFFLFLALNLYGLLRHVDRTQARLLVVFVTVAVAVGVVNELNLIAPLILLSGANFLSVFPKAQLEALALGFVQLRGSGITLDAAFWGLWLLPFGVLVIKSGTIPKVLGICLIIGCGAYLAESFIAIVRPALAHAIYPLVIPLYTIGELPILLWLIVRAAPLPPAAATAAP